MFGQKTFHGGTNALRSVFAGILLALASIDSPAQDLPQDRLRTGMAEIGLHAWSLTLEEGRKPHDVTLYGASVSRFVTDNLSVGGLLAFRADETPIYDAFCLNARVRAYFFPLQHSTPWAELRLGGMIRPMDVKIYCGCFKKHRS